MNRREALQAMGWIGAFSASLLYGCAPGTDQVTNAHPEKNLTPLEKKLYPASRMTQYKIDRPITQESIAASYNNYYEFSESKEDVDHHSQKLKTRPWQVEVVSVGRTVLSTPVRGSVGDGGAVDGIPIEGATR
jgi:sulfoxide reductase catalytic subunit YedY